MPLNKKLKVFQMNDCDWWLAHDLEEAKEHYQSTVDDDPGLVSDARELSAEELSRFQFWDDEDRDPASFRHWQCPKCGALADANCRWNGEAYEHHHGYPIGHVTMENIHRRTFAQELARRIEDDECNPPEFFASTES